MFHQATCSLLFEVDSSDVNSGSKRSMEWDEGQRAPNHLRQSRFQLFPVKGKLIEEPKQTYEHHVNMQYADEGSQIDASETSDEDDFESIEQEM